jgi:hypothetical protein
MAHVKAFGNIPDLYDERDHALFTSEHLVEATKTSRQRATSDKEVKILKPLPPVYDQGGIGSCTSNAVAAALRFAYQKATKTTYDKFDPSRQFMYFNARVRDDPRTKSDEELAREAQRKKDPKYGPLLELMKTPEWRITHDTGSSCRTNIRNLNVLGVCPETAWPYALANWKVVKDPKMDPKVFQEDMFVLTTNTGRGKNEKEEPIKDPNGHPIWSTPVRPSNWAEAFSLAKDSIPRAISYYRIIDPATKMRDDVNQKDLPLAWDINGQPPIALLEK